MEINLNLKQTQNLFLNTQLKNALELLTLNSLDLLSYVNNEAVENVILDFAPQIEDINPETLLKYKSENYYSKDDEKISEEEENNYENYTYTEETLYDYLKDQLRYQFFSEIYIKIGQFLIENIDDKGYLQGSINEFATHLGVEVHDVYFVLKKIQNFDPKGVGSRNLRECLMSQANNPLLRKIIGDHLEDIAENRIGKIAKCLNITPQEVYQQVEAIKQLNPYPAKGFNTDNLPIEYIIPEIFVTIKNGQLNIEIENSFEGRLHLNDYYVKLIEEADEETRQYLVKKLKRAMFLIDSINMRIENMHKVVGSIVKFQKDFFLYGTALSPLVMREVAQDCNLSESTVSRITDNKFLQCQRGLYPLKYFFQTALKGQDGSVSSDYIEQLIAELVENEDKKNPLSDQKITDLLNEKGINIKRRTIAKYRDELHIAPSSKRKIIY